MPYQAADSSLATKSYLDFKLDIREKRTDRSAYFNLHLPSDVFFEFQHLETRKNHTHF